MKTHERLHQGLKSYMCKLCQKTFSQLGNLKSHLFKIHQFQLASVRDHSRGLSGYEQVIDIDTPSSKDSAHQDDKRVMKTRKQVSRKSLPPLPSKDTS